MAFDISTARPVDDGSSRFDISTAKPYEAEEDKPFGQQLNDAIHDIPRQDIATLAAFAREAARI